MTLLKVEALSKSFNNIVAVQDVSFTLERGEMLAVIGPNGAGKSTLFGMIGGQLRPDRGCLLLDGADITALPSRQRFGHGIGRTFQIAQTFPSMTVAENVQMALLSHQGESYSLWSYARRCRREDALDLLGRVGMAEAADRSCATLAYGDVKRVELAIALAGDPKLLLMDEPTAGMAARERADLMTLTASLAASRRIGILFTEHDMNVVFAYAHRIIVMVQGRMIASGEPDAVRQDPQVRQAYLGDETLAIPRGDPR